MSQISNAAKLSSGGPSISVEIGDDGRRKASGINIRCELSAPTKLAGSTISRGLRSNGSGSTWDGGTLMHRWTLGLVVVLARRYITLRLTRTKKTRGRKRQGGCETPADGNWSLSPIRRENESKPFCIPRAGRATNA